MTMKIAPNGNHAGMRMWPSLSISLPLANKIADLANIFFIGSLVVGVVSTIAIVWMAGVKEAYWDEDRRHSAERIEELQSEAVKASAAIAESDAKTAQANENAAKANERTAELKLALEREIAARQPRTITPEQHAAVVQFLANAGQKGDLIVVWKVFDEEAERFGKQVISVLADAGFNVIKKDGPFSFGEAGAWIVVRDLQQYKSVPNAIGAVQAAFRQILHIELNGVQRADPFPDLGEVVVAIGAKP
jgi:hypothetical protein